MASITKRGKRKYLVRWRESPGAPERSRMFAFERDAKAFRDEVGAAIAKGNYVDPARGQRKMFGAYADEWFAIRQWRESTLERQRSIYRRHIEPTFGDRPLGSLRRTEVTTWALGLPLAPSTANGAVALLSHILSDAVEDDLIAKNPAAKVTVKDTAAASATELEAPLTVDEIRQLADAAHLRLRAAIIFTASTGLRQGELFGLTNDRVQWLDRHVVVDRQLVTPSSGPVRFGEPKSARSVRRVPVADHALEALSSHVERFGIGEGGFIFTNSNGTPWRRNTASDAFRRIVAKAGVEASGWHALRHHAASALIAEGLSVTAVAATLGHTPDECLRTYAHWWPSEHEQVRAAMSRAWETETPSSADLSRTSGAR